MEAHPIAVLSVLGFEHHQGLFPGIACLNFIGAVIRYNHISRVSWVLPSWFLGLVGGPTLKLNHARLKEPSHPQHSHTHHRLGERPPTQALDRTHGVLKT